MDKDTKEARKLSKQARALEAKAKKLRAKAKVGQRKRKRAKIRKSKQVKATAAPFRSEVTSFMNIWRKQIASSSWVYSRERKGQIKKRLGQYESVHEAFQEIMTHLNGGGRVKIWSSWFTKVSRKTPVYLDGFTRKSWEFYGDDGSYTVLNFSYGRNKTGRFTRGLRIIEMLLANTEYELL